MMIMISLIIVTIFIVIKKMDFLGSEKPLDGFLHRWDSDHVRDYHHHDYHYAEQNDHNFDYLQKAMYVINIIMQQSPS